MNNNDILCRWRDAITDPPPEKAGECGIYTIKATDGDMYVYTRCGCHGDPTWLGRHRIRDIEPGDQWLDITSIPGVPREAVQAAVDEIDTLRQHHGHQTSTCDYTETDHEQGMEDGLDEAENIILKHTGVDAARVAFEGRE